MITINPVKLNTVKPISFGEGNLNNITPVSYTHLYIIYFLILKNIQIYVKIETYI